MSESQKLLELNDVYAGYDGITVIKDVNLEVFDNDFIGIIGPNGGGKTTLIKVILGLIKPFKGRVELSPQNSDNRLQIGYLPQINTIDKNMNANTNITITIHIHFFYFPVERRQRVYAAGAPRGMVAPSKNVRRARLTHWPDQPSELRGASLSTSGNFVPRCGGFPCWSLFRFLSPAAVRRFLDSRTRSSARYAL